MDGDGVPTAGLAGLRSEFEYLQATISEGYGAIMYAVTAFGAKLTTLEARAAAGASTLSAGAAARGARAHGDAPTTLVRPLALEQEPAAAVATVVSPQWTAGAAAPDRGVSVSPQPSAVKPAALMQPPTARKLIITAPVKQQQQHKQDGQDENGKSAEKTSQKGAEGGWGDACGGGGAEGWGDASVRQKTAVEAAVEAWMDKAEAAAVTATAAAKAVAGGDHPGAQDGAVARGARADEDAPKNPVRPGGRELEPAAAVTTVVSLQGTAPATAPGHNGVPVSPQPKVQPAAVSPALREHGQAVSPEDSSRAVAVYGLPAAATADAVKAHFSSRAGTVVQLSMPDALPDANAKEHTEPAIVLFARRPDALRAARQLNGFPMRGFPDTILQVKEVAEPLLLLAPSAAPPQALPSPAAPQAAVTPAPHQVARPTPVAAAATPAPVVKPAEPTMAPGVRLAAQREQVKNKTSVQEASIETGGGGWGDTSGPGDGWGDASGGIGGWGDGAVLQQAAHSEVVKDVRNEDQSTVQVNKPAGAGAGAYEPIIKEPPSAVKPAALLPSKVPELLPAARGGQSENDKRAEKANHEAGSSGFGFGDAGGFGDFSGGDGGGGDGWGDAIYSGGGFGDT